MGVFYQKKKTIIFSMQILEVSESVFEFTTTIGLWTNEIQQTLFTDQLR